MQVHKIDYGQRVYQGTLDAIRQVIIATMLVIDSYNGETIGEPWISDRDEYVAGTTPSTGAQVAYTLAEPLEIPVTVSNLPIKSLLGYNHIESTTGDMEMEYITEEYQPLVDLIQSSKHVYSTAEQIVGTWVDGSTIYEKTVYYAGGQSGAVTFAHGISNFGKLISIEGNCYDNQENMYMPFPRVGPDGNNIGIVSVDSTNVQYAVAGAFATSVVDVYLTIRYTKTTASTRSLNLTKSAVNEIPDEIKNAEYEEKPDVNEADDDAPTEVNER